MNVVDAIREIARRAPDHPAIRTARRGAPTETLGYAELVERMEAHAARLREAGVGAGERCGLVARQGPAFVEHALGILAAGGCLVPIPDDHRDAVLDAFLGRAGIERLVRESEGFAVETPDVKGPLGDAEERAFRALGPAYLRFTSGTTSTRKGVVLGHASIEARLRAANEALGIGEDDAILWLLPMAHHFVVSILLYLRRGATLLLPASSLAPDILSLAGEGHATVLYASPYHYNLLARDASERTLPDVRLAISTAEGLRAEIAEAFRSRFGIPLTQALGIIEVGLPVWNDRDPAGKPTALGRPLPAYEVWLRGEDGQPLAGPGDATQTGEVCIRGPGLLDAYLDPWLPAAEILEPDGFRTGDQGYFDADGDLHLVGRRANRINMAGMKFFCEEVEAVLEQHPAIERSRVHARTHPHLGEIPVVDVVVAEGAAAPGRKDLAAFCKGRLPAYKIPREVRVVASLDETVTGKLRRRPGPG
ncbi:MAG: class I adenylate-forming enzyme family protein [Myxococcota bacterium]|nr:class I adenylate-forming enzyme family protein [Myxococcota bacterium]